MDNSVISESPAKVAGLCFSAKPKASAVLILLAALIALLATLLALLAALARLLAGLLLAALLLAALSGLLLLLAGLLLAALLAAALLAALLTLLAALVLIGIAHKHTPWSSHPTDDNAPAKPCVHVIGKSGTGH